jgi:CheY-like chemotaxis protein
MLSLIVDDDPFIRAHIKVLLQREGFETLEAESGNSALEVVKVLRGFVDLIVTDIQMPNGDGLSFANSVRRRFPVVPIILVSGGARPNTDFEFVEKPFAAVTLARAVRKLVPRIAKTA